jgi:2-phospho-L-lactate transferase/gluconeogenesis factor (CofD/UPF0052 family)
MIKIANFCGGRGSNSIIRAFSQYPHVRITNIVNAYDDGKSTGHIRRFFRMLGPSDIRKNQLVMMNGVTGQDAAVRALFEFRFPQVISHADAVRAIDGLIHGQADPFGLQRLIAEVDGRRKQRILCYLDSFLTNLTLYEQVLGEVFPYADCSLANCVYAGAFEMYGRDFGLTVDRVGKLLNMRGETITNSNDNRYLVAIRENGLIMNSEAEIVESRANERIHDIYIVERPLSSTEKENLDGLPMRDKVKYLQRFSNVPAANVRCLEAIKEADVILYSPGTQHSSLYPTYMTRAIGEAIRLNEDAMKVFVANVGEDYETPAYSVSELVEGALRRLQTCDQRGHAGCSYIHYVLANNVFGKTNHLSKYIQHDPAAVEALGVRCVSAGFENAESWGKHDGAFLVGTLLDLFSHFDQDRGRFC